MKKYFNVTFQYSETVFCANIAHAESAEDVERHYSKKYEWVKVSEANEWDVKDALERGKPVIEVEHIDEPETVEEPAPETVEEVEETEPARTREEVVADILSYFEENDDTFTACLEELDSYNGYLGDDRYYDMEELAEFYHDTDPLELLNRAYYGYAEDSCTVDQWGTKRHDPFNPNSDYFRYNGYGNLVSSNYKDYSDHLDRYAVDAMQEDRAELPTIDDTPELSDLFDELDRVSEAL